MHMMWNKAYGTRCFCALRKWHWYSFLRWRLAYRFSASFLSNRPVFLVSLSDNREKATRIRSKKCPLAHEKWRQHYGKISRMFVNDFKFCSQLQLGTSIGVASHFRYELARVIDNPRLAPLSETVYWRNAGAPREFLGLSADKDFSLGRKLFV